MCECFQGKTNTSFGSARNFNPSCTLRINQGEDAFVNGSEVSDEYR